MVQSFKNALISEYQFRKVHALESDAVWVEKTKTFYNNIDQKILDLYGLKKNNISFEKVLYYPITEEIISTEEKDLNKFEF